MPDYYKTRNTTGYFMKLNFTQSLLLTFLFASLLACSPKVSLEVPDKPLTINLNVKVEHEIRVRVDKELETLFENEDDLF